MKFFKLFKKELRDLMTLQTLISLVAFVGIFMLLGTVMSDVGKDMNDKMGSAVVCDRDQSQLSKQAIAMLEKAGLKITQIQGEKSEDLITKAYEIDEHTCVAVIPKGFEQGVKNSKVQEIQIVSALKSFSMMSNSDKSAQNVADIIKETISSSIIQQANPNLNAEYIKNPIKTTDITVVAGKSETINSDMLLSFAMQQSIFIPIIVFLLITMASQLNVAAIANEKNDKTLETLLSAPVSRLSVLGAKMCASGVFSLLMAGVYMFGFSSYMNGMMGGMGAPEEAMNTTGISDALANLGLKLGAGQYALIGVQLFLTILIALAISMILGALAKDLKSAQSLVMPLMFLTMIPYFVTMFLDVNSLPLVGKVLIYLIPFTHTFTASSNLLFGNYTMFFIGMVYQIVVLIIVMIMAVRVFSTDKIFTMTLEFGKKKKHTV
ncbi:ABC transporter permease [Paludicola sp. MB14-C6]|uniref:ABC transporter permease n=1 Tax=Paludihabitans sp. MB14-C6 TaxID=3070656 RepID=UPI0027DB93C7|nr:ABC transporter permease [Paludicola sp. MB14-C6]WMJ24353.1 ABC transporter permease [Paludicola sp. MB14-C6]